jgi:hypothetical protein
MQIQTGKAESMISTEFLFAGRAVFTVSNNKGEHFTFKIAKHNDKDMFFANVMSGGADVYTYMGVCDKLTGKIFKGKNGISSDAKSVKVLEWAIRVVKGEAKIPADYDIQHSGVCGRCGRELTDPESLATGLGSTCRGLVK